jgi:hypothetical protein
MKNAAVVSLFVVLAVVLGYVVPAVNAGTSDEWVSLFNGKDLTGWDGDPRLWSVKDGVIHGETTEQNPARNNTFLVWRGGSPKDFELKIKFRIQNGNSGVQYRSKEFDKWRIAGYQAEVVNGDTAGFLYHEGGRASLVNVGEFVVIDKNGTRQVVGNVNDKQELIKTGFVKEKDWNAYHIICRGNHIVHYLNGYKTMELIDDDRVTNPADPKDNRGASREGLIALQIHVGPPMVVEFKDISLKQIDEKRYGDAQLIFNGRNLDEWTTNAGSGKANLWKVGKAKVSASNPKLLEAVPGTGEMINVTPEHGASQDIYSKAEFGDCRIELEVMVPQESNSGVYVMGEYEVQVLDSYGHGRLNNGDMGAIYGAAPPSINASKKPGQWQQYVIEWRAPRFDGAKKVKNAEFLSVELNGQLLHKNLVMPDKTPGGVVGKEAPEGPLMFQGNHGPVAYRNIVVTPLVR